MHCELLDVLLPYNNPLRWHSRLNNFRRCEDGMLKSGVRLTTVELAYGDRPFDLPDREGVRRVRLRGHDILWSKENIENIGFANLPPDARYVAMVDGDVVFYPEQHWASDTVHALQTHAMVQVSDRVIWLGPKDEFVGDGISFMKQYSRARRHHYTNHYYHPDCPIKPQQGYPGHAWAYRRDAFIAMGGLLDVCILGAGDYHMAMALFDLDDRLTHDHDYTETYRDALKNWGARARIAIKENIGSVPAISFHLWHGALQNRAYSTREQILIRNRYDPTVDIHRDHLGLIHFAHNKPKLRTDIRSYFAERDEDCTWLGHGRHGF